MPRYTISLQFIFQIKYTDYKASNSCKQIPAFLFPFLGSWIMPLNDGNTFNTLMAKCRLKYEYCQECVQSQSDSPTYFGLFGYGFAQTETSCFCLASSTNSKLLYSVNIMGQDLNINTRSTAHKTPSGVSRESLPSSETQPSEDPTCPL